MRVELLKNKQISSVLFSWRGGTVDDAESEQASPSPHSANENEGLEATTEMVVDISSALDELQTVLHDQRPKLEDFQSCLSINFFVPPKKGEGWPSILETTVEGPAFDVLSKMCKKLLTIRLHLSLAAVNGIGTDSHIEIDMSLPAAAILEHKYVLLKPCIWNGREFGGTINVELIVHEEDSLMDETTLGESDFFLVAKTGSKIPCKQELLARHSSVLKRMLETNQADKTYDLEMSERGIRALLSFMEGRTIETFSKDASIAVELLKVAHHHSIPGLETEMKILLQGQPEQWFSADVALLFYFWCAKLNKDGYDELRNKSVQVLIAKLPRREIRKSYVYYELYEQDPQPFIDFSVIIAEL